MEGTGTNIKQTATNTRKREMAAKLGIKFNDLKVLRNGEIVPKKKAKALKSTKRAKRAKKTAPVNGTAAPGVIEGLEMIPLGAIPRKQSIKRQNNPGAPGDLAMLLAQCLLEVLRRP